jgi:two-component system catabolic regulation response regulator CreB/two-component system response regulator ChvI
MLRNILLVDDEKGITEILKTGLEGRGFHVDAYNDSADALANFKSGKYDIVITDIRMPQMNGFELYREIRKIDEKVGICFFTAFDIYNDEFEKMFPQVRVKGFLKKPVSIAQIVARLKEFESS